MNSLTPAPDQASRLRSLVQALRARGGQQPQADPAPSIPPTEPVLPSPASSTTPEAPAIAPSPPPRPQRPVIAIASGKGGVGKSVIATNLAVALARQNHQPAIVDADLGAANCDILLGERPLRRLGAEPQARLADLALESRLGPLLIPGHVGVRRPDLAPDALFHRLHTLDGVCDVILIDLPAGLDPLTIETLAQADLALIVTTPEPPALADAYAIVKAITHRRAEGDCAPRQRLELVVNQVRDEDHARSVHARLAQVAQRFLGRRVPLFAAVPRCPAVPRSIGARTPVVVHESSTPAACALLDAASRMSDILDSPERAKPAGLSGF